MTSFVKAIGIEAIAMVAPDWKVRKTEARSAEYPLTPTIWTTYPKDYSEDYPMNYPDILT